MYKRKLRSWVKHLDFIVIDELCAWVSLLLAFLIGDSRGNPVIDERQNTLILIILGINLLVIISFNTMDEIVHRGKYKEFAAIVKQTATSMILVALAVNLRQENVQFPYVVTVTALCVYLPFTYISRMYWKRFLRSHPRLEGPGHAVLVVTDEKHAPEIIHRMREYSLDRYSIVGLVFSDRDATDETIEGVHVVASLDDAADYICRNWIDEIFFFHFSLDEHTSELLAKCREMALTIHMYIDLQGVDENKQTIDRIAGFNVVTASINTISAHDAIIKRCFDIVAGIFGSIFTLLLMAGLAPFILRASPGPLLFKQERIGENGRKFKMYKIRSMYVDADRRKQELIRQNTHDSGMMFKMEFDPRVIGNVMLPNGEKKTGVGDFIRRTSLDEFPQFFNILKGDMSVVGTRPPTVDEWEKYQYRHRARMSVRPGLTGLWQINKRKDKMPFDEVVRLDTEYISNWSIGADLRIMVQTGLNIFHSLLGKDSDAKKTDGDSANM